MISNGNSVVVETTRWSTARGRVSNMGLSNFKIIFDNTSNNTYYPGQSVIGHVIVDLNDTKVLRCIKINVKGEAHNEWKVVTQVSQTGRREEEFSAHEEYFTTKQCILGSASGNRMELPAGEFRYPFNFILPANLPGSFEGAHGHVRYTIEAIIDRPWRFDHKTEATFTVMAFLDLNQRAGASEKVYEEMRKSFGCFCLGTRPLAIDVYLPARGYVPGQEIPIRINVENQSGVAVKQVKIRLQKTIIYHATRPRKDTKVEVTDLAEMSKGPVSGDGSRCYEEKLKVPKTPQVDTSNLASCEIIEIKYQLKVEANASGCCRLPFIREIPVFIGNIPLSSFVAHRSSTAATPETLNHDSNINEYGFSTAPFAQLPFAESTETAPKQLEQSHYSDHCQPRNETYYHSQKPGDPDYRSPSFLERIAGCCSRNSKVSTI